MAGLFLIGLLLAVIGILVFSGKTFIIGLILMFVAFFGG